MGAPPMDPMDSFLQSLMTGQQTPSKRCILVVDNARHHLESWGELPRKVRRHLRSRDLCEPMMDGSNSRWDLDGSASTRSARTSFSDEPKSSTPLPPSQPRRQQSASAPLPPSQPRRQQSVGGEQSADPSSADNRGNTAPLPPSQPQRQKSIDAQDWAPQPRQPRTQMAILQEALKEEESPVQVPRMPRRKPSQDFRMSQNSSQLPQLPQTHQQPMLKITRPEAFDAPDKLSAPMPQSLLGSFSAVKRSSASLLSDDEDSDSEGDDCPREAELFKNAFEMMRAAHGF